MYSICPSLISDFVFPAMTLEPLPLRNIEISVYLCPLPPSPGRLMVPKGAVKVIKAPVKTTTNASEFKSPKKANVQSPTKTILKPDFPVPSYPRYSERESLVEVSICEPCNSE